VNYPGEHQCTRRYKAKGLAWVIEKRGGEEGKSREQEQNAGFAASNHAFTL
jgi:hypothetical protein